VGTKPPSTTDRRVQRTRRALREALVALILERGWEGFSVQDVCDRADVARSTFYTHFADKEELVGGGFDDLRRALRAQLAASGRPGPLGFSRGLIEHAHEQRRLFLAVVGKKSGHLVQQRFRDLVLDLVREDLGAALAPGPRRDAVAAFVAGAFIELLTWSLEAKRTIPPDELDALFHDLADPVLAVAGRPDGTSRAPRGDRGDG
jgi:AcrR family transcriptional regulator